MADDTTKPEVKAEKPVEKPAVKVTPRVAEDSGPKFSKRTLDEMAAGKKAVSR